uniref:Uncharacterized protein n=1 Tax=Anguilla anguilla TaxID=7936 RepID=A0A0E9XT35_ANGAN
MLDNTTVDCIAINRIVRMFLLFSCLFSTVVDQGFHL